jgi:hypothetical protein
MLKDSQAALIVAMVNNIFTSRNTAQTAFYMS